MKTTARYALAVVFYALVFDLCVEKPLYPTSQSASIVMPSEAIDVCADLLLCASEVVC